MEPTPIAGVVGLGVMGGRIAGRLLDSGYTVVGTNRTPERAVPLVERGLVWCDTPRQVAAAADVVLSSVADDAALEAVAGGADGIIGSPLLKGRAPLVVDPDVGPVWFDIAMMQKDLVLALDAARQLGVPLPTTAAANDLLTLARGLGYERRDVASVHEALAELADGR